MKWVILSCSFVGLFALVSFLGGWFEPAIDYNTEVKPILNKHCLGCHGGVKKAGGVSFLFEQEMYQPAKSAKPPVVAGDADASEMMHRLTSHDLEERMPKDAEALDEKEIETLRKWIDQGAKWGEHWSYKRVEKPKIPKTGSILDWFGLGSGEKDWAKNEIDHFIIEKYKENKLEASQEADRATLIRRVYLDLTGLPPTLEQVAAFQNDKSENAYEKVVDDCLKSSAYGERWAGMWLDLARYADTKGYERDPGRNIWRYRDWLINSFNQDKPYNQFTIEQLAGDLLPNPSNDQLIATGFHRNTMNNDEGGTQDEEFRIAALIDRVNTTWEVWQGTTFGCIQCHSHPYDPFRHDEYYNYLAFFNNTRDEDVTSDTPTLRFYSKADSLKIRKLTNWVNVHTQNTNEMLNFQQFVRVLEPKINSHAFDQQQKASIIDAKYFGVQDGGSARIPNLTLTDKNRLLMAIGADNEGSILQIRLDSLKGEVLANINVPMTKSAWSDTVLILKLPNIKGKHHLYLTNRNPKRPKNWTMIKWVSVQKALSGETLPEYAQIEKLYADVLTGSTDGTPILWEGKGDLARTTHVFVRGNWSVNGSKVEAEIPDLFGKKISNRHFENRLDLAKWIASRDNPLTARVIVNRLWEQLFGVGIVETVEDFGSQGIAPTHQALLDWLAVELMETNKWSLKKTLKQMVMSATYRQSTTITPDKLAKDPFNRWLSRGARVRLSAEQVRDQAMMASGLLSKKMFGPSVMPPQPDGIWESPYSGESWVLSEGQDRYRRGVYTYWKRTSPYPSMIAFDAPSREFCQSRRLRTNTPLQALVTLNDPVYLEAAQHLAEKMIKKQNPNLQIAEGYRLLTFRNIPVNRQKTLLQLYQNALKSYRQNPQAACEFLNYVDAKKVSPELAALSATANALLNLDEVVTKQ